MIERLVILGAGGDLTSRYLLPALAILREAGKLPPGFAIDAVSQEEISSSDYRRKVEGPLRQHGGAVSDENRAAVLEAITYHRADVRDSEAIGPIVNRAPIPAIYLALPPAIFHPTVEAIAATGIDANDAARIVVEKPHGEDLESTQSLNRLLHTCFSEESVFRIDHFLGHQTVQNLLGIRFANRMFEPVWNCNHIEQVEIRYDETLALEGRAGYYDRTGALEDMLQNHLLQLLCFVAMEPPMGFNKRDLRDKKVELLRAVRTLSQHEVEQNSVRARYETGRIGGRAVPAYVGEEGVDPKQNTETFAQVTLMIDNWRWAGTPFVLRSGKALDADRQEVIVRFRDVPFALFGADGTSGPNILRLSFDPDRLALELNLNGAGDPFELEPAKLELDLPAQSVPPYARLLLDLLEGDATFSIRADEAEEGWRIIEPIRECWRSDCVPMQSYPAGSQFEP